MTRLPLFLMLAGCLEPNPADGAIACALEPLKRCPDGYSCAGDDHCWRNPDAYVPDLGADLICGAGCDLATLVRLTVMLSGDAASDGRVTADSTTLDCGTSCELLVAPGTTVTLAASALPRRGAWFSGYVGGGCDKSPQCAVTLSADVTVTAQFDRANYMFVSSQKLPLPFGSNSDLALANADSVCNTLAGMATLPGRFRAWLSVAGGGPHLPVDAVDRLSGVQGWLRPDDRPFADLPPVGANPLYYPPRIDETGADVGQVLVATGSNPNGRVASNCADFSSATTGYTLGGMSDRGVGHWSGVFNAPCSNGSLSIYCFGVDHATAVVPPPPPGRQAFVAGAGFTPSAGRDSADALCRMEAMANGLASWSSFLALLDTSSESAASRFDLTGATWYRPDGVALAPSPAGLFTDTLLLAPIDLAADGATYVKAAFLMTGHTAAPTAADTCGDWSPAGTTGVLGDPASTDGSRFTGSAVSCSGSYSVYCLQN